MWDTRLQRDLSWKEINQKVSNLRPSPGTPLRFWQSLSVSRRIFHGSIPTVTSRLSTAQTGQRPDGEMLTLALKWSFPPKSRAEGARTVLGSDGTRAGSAENSKARMLAWMGICVGSRLVSASAYCGKGCGELFLSTEKPIPPTEIITWTQVPWDKEETTMEVTLAAV